MDISNISNVTKPTHATQTPTIPGAEKMQQEKNASIIKAQMDISVRSGDEPMSLLYKSVLESINEELEPFLGSNNIQKAYVSGLDVSPEATADRIVTSATTFFAAFIEQNQELSEDDALAKFIDVISGGIDKGFQEARDVLDGLSVLKGEIASNIDLTYEIVQTGLDRFAEQHSES